MYQIILISTRHSELGKCNADELYKIIVQLNPDVIFEELANDLVEWVYKNNEFPYEPLEVKSIKRYLQDHDIKHIPADNPPTPTPSSQEIDYLFSEFGKYFAFRNIEDKQRQMVEQDGFNFLNSKKNVELVELKRKIEASLIQFAPNKNTLQRIHKQFYEQQDTREYEIIKNIYQWSKENQYNKAILLMGAGHRKSIFEKIKAYKSPDNLKLHWTLYGN